MFESIEIKQYRGIKHLKIDNLKQFNLVVGATNIGKTSMLEAIFIAINPDNMGLVSMVNSIRRIPYSPNYFENFFYKADPSNDINIIAKTKEEKENIRKLKYCAILDQETPIDITDKSPIPTASSAKPLVDKISLIINDDTEYKYTLKPLNELEREGNVLINPFRKELVKGNPYKMTFNGRYEHALHYTGSFSAKYDGIVENKEKKDFLDLIRRIDPKLNTLEKTEKGVLIDYGFKKLLPIQVLGMGMIKIINIIAAIFNTKNGLLLIDELENGVHYELLELFWKTIFNTASEFNVQIIATTHSFDCIQSYNKAYSGLEQNENLHLYRIEKNEDDECEITEYNHEEINSYIEKQWEIR
jgi:AAA15 family ATPase/GTPase